MTRMSKSFESMPGTSIRTAMRASSSWTSAASSPQAGPASGSRATSNRWPAGQVGLHDDAALVLERVHGGNHGRGFGRGGGFAIGIGLGHVHVRSPLRVQSFSSMRRGLAFSRLGTVMRRMPSRYFASMRDE